MTNKPFRIDKLHKCNGMISMLIICERYYIILMEIVVPTFYKFGEHIF